MILLNYIYIIKADAIFSDNSIIDISEDFMSLTINNDYDNNVFPIMELNTFISPNTYYKIQTDNDVKILLTIKKYNSDDISEKNISPICNYFIKDKVFKIFNKNKSPINILNDNNPNYDVPSIKASYLLVSKDDLDNNKKIVNNILVNSDITSCLLYLINKMKNKSIIFQKPDNNKIYNQIIIPPLNIIRNIKYIDSTYGIYNNGLRLYFDYNNYFIINKLDNTKVNGVPNKYKDVYIDIFNSNDNDYGYGKSSLDSNADSKFYSTFTTINKVLFSNATDSSKEFIGSNPIFLNQQDSLIKRYYGNENYKTRIFYNKYNNIYKEKELFNSMEYPINISCSIFNMDIDSIICSNLFHLIFHNDNYKNYSGNYHILKSNLTFLSNNDSDNGYSILQTDLLLKKI